MDVVSEVLVDRARELSGIERMLGASVAAHVGLVALIVLAPAGWWSRGEVVPESVMTISLSAGEDGPIPGMTALSARPVQSLATEVLAQPKDVIERLKKLMGI